eukprot:1152714-Pelagomonas_calceolata.AAC.1
MPILYDLRTNLPLPDVPLNMKRLITLVPWSSVMPETHPIHINSPLIFWQEVLSASGSGIRPPRCAPMGHRGKCVSAFVAKDAAERCVLQILQIVKRLQGFAPRGANSVVFQSMGMIRGFEEFWRQVASAH